MAAYQEPIIGAWYVNRDGQFLRAWGGLYHGGELCKVVIQQLNGKRVSMGLAKWRSLDLVRYPEPSEQRSGNILY